MNVAANTAPGEDLQSILLYLVDALTPIHLRLLKHFERRAPVPIGTAPEWMKSDVCA